MSAYVQTFDGLEGAPAPSSVPCACGEELRFDLWAFTARARSGWSLTDAEAAAFGLHRSDWRGITVTTVSPDGPQAFVGELSCPECGRTTPVVVGLHEFQPMRWMGGVVRG